MLISGVRKMRTILTATDNTEDAKEVKAYLAEEFANLSIIKLPPYSPG
jgi:hypothetical protein